MRKEPTPEKTCGQQILTKGENNINYTGHVWQWCRGRVKWFKTLNKIRIAIFVLNGIAERAGRCSHPKTIF